MSNPTVTFRVSPELKKEAESVLQAAGLSLPEAMRVFLQQCVNARGLPFRPTAEWPITNETTLQSLRDLDAGRVTKVRDMKELFEKIG